MRISLVLMVLSAVALADDAQSAREHFDKGSRLYDIGQYKDAAREYEEAYKLKPDPSLLFNMGQAYRLGGFYEEALRSYRSFLRRQPKGGHRAEVQDHIATLQKLVDEQKKASSKPPLGTVPPESSEPPKVEAKPQTKPDAKPVALAPSPQPESTEVWAEPHRSVDQPVYKRWWLWTAIAAVAVVGVGVGVGLAYGLPKDAPVPSGAYTVSFH